jgi:hypothetical protein
MVVIPIGPWPRLVRFSPETGQASNMIIADLVNLGGTKLGNVLSSEWRRYRLKWYLRPA